VSSSGGRRVRSAVPLGKLRTLRVTVALAKVHLVQGTEEVASGNVSIACLADATNAIAESERERVCRRDRRRHRTRDRDCAARR
jgi:hypothetical protein